MALKILNEILKNSVPIRVRIQVQTETLYFILLKCSHILSTIRTIWILDEQNLKLNEPPGISILLGGLSSMHANGTRKLLIFSLSASAYYICFVLTPTQREYLLRKSRRKMSCVCICQPAGRKGKQRET